MKEFSIDIEANSAFIVALIEIKMPKDIYTKWREHISKDDVHSSKKIIKFLR